MPHKKSWRNDHTNQPLSVRHCSIEKGVTQSALCREASPWDGRFFSAFLVPLGDDFSMVVQPFQHMPTMGL
jgi:helix-turn-helix protein